MCKKLVRQHKLIRTNTVTGHQQPTREARFGGMETIASRGLRNL
jgi:hypothetical protein